VVARAAITLLIHGFYINWGEFIRTASIIRIWITSKILAELFGERGVQGYSEVDTKVV